MKSIIVISTLSAISFVLSGCLISNSMSYKIDLKTKNSGSAELIITDIRSDAVTDEEFEEDKRILFEDLLKGDTFIEDMKSEGKIVTSRMLGVENGTLYGKITFTFDQLGSVENVMYEDGFYFLTLAPDDSILATNGEIISSQNLKRIIWDDTFTTLEFTMLSEPALYTKTRALAPFYKK